MKETGSSMVQGRESQIQLEWPDIVLPLAVVSAYGDADQRPGAGELSICQCVRDHHCSSKL